MPAIIIENKKTFLAMRRSFSLVKAHLPQALGVVLIPSMLFIPVFYAHARLPLLMERFFPEVTLYVMAFRIFMLVAIDLLVTTGATILFLRYRERETGSAAS
jgi:hypothetical protein